MIVLLFLTGCTNEPLNRQKTDNNEIVVDTLFTKDGCTVYRFYDSRSVYFVKCNSGEAQTQSYYSCGKGCVKHDNVMTYKTN
jgi:hypothetical protein